MGYIHVDFTRNSSPPDMLVSTSEENIILQFAKGFDWLDGNLTLNYLLPFPPVKRLFLLTIEHQGGLSAVKTFGENSTSVTFPFPGPCFKIERIEISSFTLSVKQPVSITSTIKTSLEDK